MPMVGIGTSRSSSPGPGPVLTRANTSFRASAGSVGVDVVDVVRGVRLVGLSSDQSMTGFSTEPIPSTSQRTRSPGSRKTGGSRKTPTPDGVPVAMMSPGSRVTVRLMNSISSATGQIMSAVVLDCIGISRPASGPEPGIRHEAMRSVWGSGSSSAVTRTAPIGRNVSEPLARSHWPSPTSPSARAAGVPCQSRALTSLTTT